MGKNRIDILIEESKAIETVAPYSASLAIYEAIALSTTYTFVDAWNLCVDSNAEKMLAKAKHLWDVLSNGGDDDSSE